MIGVRKGDEKDIEAVWNLVNELAIFENEPQEVVTTPESFLKDYKKGYFELLIAENKEDGDIAGMMLYYDTFSTWKGRMVYLEDFYVREVYRRKGIGNKLFDALIEEAKAKNATLIKWQVLDWNDSAVKFYEKLPATIEKNWWNCKYFLK